VRRRFTTNTTTLKGRQVTSLTAGRLDGRPEVVLLAGLGMRGYIEPWADLTSRWTKATLLDLPGWRFGRLPACRPTLGDLAATVAEWLEATGRTRVVLVGHSTGSQVMASAALLAPDRVVGVVLGGPTFLPSHRGFGLVLLEAVRTFSREVPGELWAIIPWALRSGVLPLIPYLRSTMRDTPEQRVRHLGKPVLVLTGEADGLAPPPWAAQLAASAEGEFVVLPGAHNCCFPFAEEADTALRSAVARWITEKTSAIQ
jgi:pimeloyl-ACP methyl ester carboxylesterase